MARGTRLDGLEVSIRTGRPAVPSQKWRLTRMVDGERVTVKRKIVVHTFAMGDVEDPYLYAAFPLSEWQNTEKGRWVMEHAMEPPTFYCDTDPMHFGYRVAIWAILADADITYFELKYGRDQESRTV